MDLRALVPQQLQVMLVNVPWDKIKPAAITARLKSWVELIPKGVLCIWVPPEHFQAIDGAMQELGLERADTLVWACLDKSRKSGKQIN